MALYSETAQHIFDSLEFDGAVVNALLEAPSKQFTSLGYVACRANSSELPIGIKKRSLGEIAQRVRREWAVADLLVSHCTSDVTLSLPKFTMGVMYDGLPVGILTEDFTENDSIILEEEKFKIPPISYSAEAMPTPLHRKIYETLDGVIYPEAFGHMSGVVNGRQVLIDVDDISFTNVPPLKRFYDQLGADPASFTRDIAELA